MKSHVKLIITFVLLIIYILLYELFFLNINEIFTGAHTLGVYIKDLCLATIASLIFYVVYNLLPDLKRKNKINIMTNSKVNQLLGFSKKLMISIITDNDPSIYRDNIKTYSIKDNLSKITIELLQNIRFNSIPKYFSEKSRNQDWSFYLGYFITHVKSIIDEILQFEMYVDDDIVYDLLKIQLSAYYSDITAFNNNEFARNNSSLSVCLNHFSEYFRLVSDLEKHFEKCDVT